MTSHYIPYCWTCTDQQNKGPHPKHRKDLQRHNISLNRIQALYHSKLNHKKSRNHIRVLCENRTKHKACSTKKISKHIYNKFCPYKYHEKEIIKLCNTEPTTLSSKFKSLMRNFHQKDPNCSTYKKSIISFFMTSFDKINQHYLISILWSFCHLHSSNRNLLQTSKSHKHKQRPKYQKSSRNKRLMYFRGVRNTKKRTCCNIHRHAHTAQRAYMSQHETSARNKFPVTDLETDWIIDSGVFQLVKIKKRLAPWY